MGEKKQNKNEGEKKNDGNGGGKKEDSGPITVVFKLDLQWEYRVVKHLKGLDGVANAKADSDTNKVTVIGKVDPSMLREELGQKTKKKVEPAPKKDKKNDDGGGDKKAEKKPEKKAEVKKPEKKAEDKKQEKKAEDKKPEKKAEDKKKPEKKAEDKKPEKKAEDKKPEKKAEDNKKPEKKAEDKKKPEKKPRVTTAVLKIDFCCAGCIDNIVSKTKGVESKSIDEQKNLVTVTGTMDVKALVESLKDSLKTPVEIVPPKKDAGGGGGGKKKAKDGDKKADGGGKKEERVKAEENYFTAGRGQFYPAHPAQKFALAVLLLFY